MRPVGIYFLVTARVPLVDSIEASTDRPVRCLGVSIEGCREHCLPAGAGRQDPAEQVQVKDQGDDEYQAPPASRGAEHNDDDGDPNCQQQPDHKR